MLLITRSEYIIKLYYIVSFLVTYAIRPSRDSKIFLNVHVRDENILDLKKSLRHWIRLHTVIRIRPVRGPYKINWRASCLTPLFKNFTKVRASVSRKENTPLCGLCYVCVSDKFAVDTLVIELLSPCWYLQNVAIPPWKISYKGDRGRVCYASAVHLYTCVRWSRWTNNRPKN
jgi:hypothetical protein